MRLIDADALLEQMKKRREYVGRPSDPVCLVEDAPTVAFSDQHITINWTPDLDKLSRDVAFRGLNEFTFLGKSIREWVEIILEQQGWVSVKDRLPEKYGSYLTLREGQLMPPQTRMAVRFWTGNKDGNYWRGAEAGSRIVGITHWMPLPEPPEEVSGDA